MTTGPPRLLLDGLHFGEGPRWHDGRLWLSDFYDHAVKAVDDGRRGDTVVEVPDPAVRARLAARRPDARRLDGRPQGAAARAGRPGRARRPLAASPRSTATTWSSTRTGGAYVGNFGFDLDGFVAEHGVRAALGEPGPPRATLARVDPDGTVHVAADDLRFPNGTVITPDGRR